MSAAAPDSSGKDRHHRRQTTSAVFTGSTGIEELSDGYRLSFPESGAWKKKLDWFAVAWQESCPHMTFEVQAAEQGAGWRLDIRGPEGTKEWVLSARAMLGSSLNPAVTLGHKAVFAWRLLSSPLRMLPDFLIIGAMKCGTTSLYSYLIAHPNIASAFRKEIDFFDGLYGRGLTFYKSFFPLQLEKQFNQSLRRQPFVTGEATPNYLYHAHVAERIARDLPNARFLVLLRNPIDRAYSFYNHNRRAGLETLSFAEAIERESERLQLDPDPGSADGFGFYRNNFSYLERGVYVDQLEVWRQYVPAERLLVLTTEDLSHQPEQVLRQVLAFLDLPYVAPAQFRHMNAAPYSAMDAATREGIAERIRPHNERLYEFLGRDLGWS